LLGEHTAFISLTPLAGASILNSMKASAIKILSRLMIGLIVAVSLSVLINYLFTRYNRTQNVQKTPQVLDSEMVRSAEGLDYSDHRNGKLRFRIHAEKLLETNLGKSLLEGIEARDFNPDGSVRNEIRSKRAEYDRDRNLADFSGDVRVFFGDGIEMRTESLHYDLNSGIGESSDPLQFYSREASGKARGLRFDQKNKSLELKSEVDLVVMPKRTVEGGRIETGNLHATSSRAHASEGARRILLEGNVRLDSGTSTLSGEKVEAVFSSDQKKLTYLTAIQDAIYRSGDPGGARQLSGQRIIFGIGESSGALERMAVLGDAKFSLASPSAEQTLNGAEIYIEFDVAKNLPRDVLSRTGASLRMKKGPEETFISGDQITAKFSAGTNDVENLNVGKHARMSAQGAADAASQELEADDIRVSFRKREGQTGIERLDAEGAARWTLKPPRKNPSARRDPARTLETSRLEMIYSPLGDFLESGHAAGKVIMTETSVDGAARPQIRRLQADDAQFHFFPENNQLKSLDARGHVRVDYEKKPVRAAGSSVEKFHTESENMQAAFELRERESAVRSVSQWGNFRYRDDSRTATAGRCDYDAHKAILVLSESPLIVSQETGSTSGELMEYDQRQKLLLVHKRVRSKLAANGGAFFGASTSSPTIITADELQYWMENQRARYSGSVQLLSENGQLQSRELEIFGAGTQVEARGDVVHLVPIPEASGAAENRQPQTEAKKARNSENVPMIIKSSQLRYLKEKNSITYTGNVTLRSRDVNLSSASLDAVLDKQGKRIERATAKGKVAIQQGARECKGEIADYYLDPGKFVVTGEPAEIYDPGKGRSFARRLTSFTTDDRILIEDQ